MKLLKKKVWQKKLRRKKQVLGMSWNLLRHSFFLPHFWKIVKMSLGLFDDETRLNGFYSKSFKKFK